MCTAACGWLLEQVRGATCGATTATPEAPSARGSTRCLLCNRAWCNFCPLCSSATCVHLREGQTPCALRRAVEETNMREYMRWIAATFPHEQLDHAPITYAAAIARFKERFPRDSHEYGDTLNYFMLRAGQRYMRMGVVEFVDELSTYVGVVDQIAGSMDGEMHEYIQWIRRNRGSRQCNDTTIAAVIDRFLEQVRRDSPMYRAAFRSFSCNRAFNHAEAYMDEFVRELSFASALAGANASPH